VSNKSWILGFSQTPSAIRFRRRSHHNNTTYFPVDVTFSLIDSSQSYNTARKSHQKFFLWRCGFLFRWKVIKPFDSFSSFIYLKWLPSRQTPLLSRSPSSLSTVPVPLTTRFSMLLLSYVYIAHLELGQELTQCCLYRKSTFMTVSRLMVVPTTSVRLSLSLALPTTRSPLLPTLPSPSVTSSTSPRSSWRRTKSVIGSVLLLLTSKPSSSVTSTLPTMRRPRTMRNKFLARFSTINCFVWIRICYLVFGSSFKGCEGCNGLQGQTKALRIIDIVWVGCLFALG